MATNPYVNKVVYGADTIIDISGTTATADKILQGYGAFGADGSWMDGTAVAGGGGGGLVYEMGTWTPTTDIARGEISYNNQHTTMPIFVAIADTDTGASLTSNSNTYMGFIYEYGALGFGVPYSKAASYFRYGFATYGYFTSSASSYSITACGNNGSGNMNTNNVKYWADENKFYPYTTSESRYWRSGKTYKWIAVWGPTT